ncbi:integrase [Spirochaetia bacterium]|nr:integrase [Spirochaetia bacterium]
MGLKMSEKKALTKEISARYRQAERKEKTSILDESIKTSGYNRQYASRMLKLQGLKKKGRATKKKRASNHQGKLVYGPDFVKVLRDIWQFFWYKCGKYLAPFMQETMPYLEASREPDFHLTPEIKQKLLKISPATIDRKLKSERAKLQIRGISGTRCGEAALIKQIPIRTHYSPAESTTPGYFQTDTVHHCGDNDSGEFNLTLTVTDVASGWSEFRALRNKAHKWTLEGLQNVHSTLPFAMIELHSDNGSEFINYDTLNWWKITKTLDLSRSRSRHKNDNCYAEQKNNAFVRNYIGYYRLDTEKELAALGRVYAALCPLLNCFIPNKKLISKTSVGSKTVKNYDRPKTPYQRLLESTHLADEVKARLIAFKELYNPVVLQQAVHWAVNSMLAAHQAKLRTKA